MNFVVKFLIIYIYIYIYIFVNICTHIYMPNCIPVVEVEQNVPGGKLSTFLKMGGD